MKKKIILITLLLFIFQKDSQAQITEADFEKAMKLNQGEDISKAITNLELLEKKFPKDGKVMFLRGFYQFRDGDKNAAMMSFTNAIKNNPKFALAFGARAQLFAKKGMFEKSIVDISEAIKLEPENADFYNTRTQYYIETKQFAEALQDFKTKIQLAPLDIMGYYDAAQISKTLNPDISADNFFIQAYAVKGMDKAIVDALFGKFLMTQNRFDEAKIKYESALADGEKLFDGQDFNNAAIVFYKTKNYDKAILNCNKAIAITPDNIDFRCNLASVYTDLKDWQKVKQTAEAALAVNDNHPIANMYMAIGLKYTGNPTKALEYEAKAKRLDAEQNK